MKKATRILALVLCAVMCLGLFVGCGNKGKQNSDTPSNSGRRRPKRILRSPRAAGRRWRRRAGRTEIGRNGRDWPLDRCG